MIKILVVDDEPGLCHILRKTFSDMGFTVLEANDGKTALSFVKKEKPAIVFLDIRMMGMNGLEVLREIKKIDAGIKVIMVTVLDDEKTKNDAKELGADEFITKPFDTDHLEEVLKKHVSAFLEDKEKP